MNYIQLLERAKLYVLRYFATHPNDSIVYHNREHTEDVVKAVSLLANHYQLNDHDLFTVLVAAWFHDTGYYNGPVTGHEKRGADLAAMFLYEEGVDQATINNVQDCILATIMPQKPVNLLQQIICDADLSNVGTENFTRKNKLLRKETEIWEGRHISKEEWRNDTIQFLQRYHYHTDYAKQLYDEIKLQNTQLLQQKVAAAKEAQENTLKKKEPAANAEALSAFVPEMAKTKKSDRPERGIETMFRISSGNHQRLSDMADNKAHIMITTTSIIISVLLSILLRKLEDNPQLILPTTLLLVVCVATLVFCIIATRPNLPKGVFTRQDIDKKRVNLLFFGNFYKMSFEEYSEGMKAMMNDKEFLYGSLTRDVYSQGIVLGHKYRLLRIGYNIFMFGIVASVVAFVVASVA
jgi:predicted metal-dependent HD superfamily phosphohydrolase